MAKDNELTAGAPPDFIDNFHVLAGWTASDLGSRMVLKLQAIQATGDDQPSSVKQIEFMMNQTQAAQLGQFLFHAAGQTPPRRRFAWLTTWLANKLER